MPLRSLPRPTGRQLLVSLITIATLAGIGAPTVAAETPNTVSIVAAQADNVDNTGTEGGGNGSTGTGDGGAAGAGTGGQRAAAEASVESLQVERSTVRAQLAQASSARNQQYDEWSLRHLAAGAAVIEADRAAQALDSAKLAVVAAEERVREYATEAYINPPVFQSQAVLSIKDADEMSWAHDVLSITADDQQRVVGELETARDAARSAAETAAEMSANATQLESEEKAKLDELEASVRRQQNLAAAVESRLDNALSEVAALEAIDRQAARELAQQEEELADEARGLVAGTTQQQPDSQNSATPSRSTPAPAPRTTAPTRRPSTPAAPSPPRSATPPSGTVTWSDVTKVGGIWVNKSIAGNVRALLDAASASGVRLSGGGFRDPSEQIALRRAHCGPTQYDIYQKPASQCSPPTATPGRSMHERGLAIDFKYNGALITSRSNGGYQWLAANASRFGFYNLPSEPWHWSTNGN